MTVTVKHSKTNAISDWTQAQLDEQIALGNFAEGTTLAQIVLPSDWNNDHTLTGVGTMAEQNANSVAITGGTINNTSIGATTASTGKFTSVTTPSVTASSLDLAFNTLTTGKININDGQATGALSSPLKIVYPNQYSGTAGSVNKLDLYSNQYGLGLSVSGGTASLDLIAAGTANTQVAMYTGNGVSTKQMAVTNTASAVNYVQVTGAATNNPPTFSMQGSDANISAYFVTKGTGSYSFWNNGGTTYRNARIDGSVQAVNYVDLYGSTAGNAIALKSNGSDTNISMAFQPKGTGAIDLAAGSSGVNISNGGTVTAITRINPYTVAYTSVPTVAISAPTTAGGVQATATCQGVTIGATPVSGGTGYTVNDVLSVTGLSGTNQITVTSVSSGVITGASITGVGYPTVPSNPVSVTGGTGTGATFNLTYQVGSAFTITNAGSGYIEQPTVSFSGGGGSGASAYATVGSSAVIRALGGAGSTSLDVYTPASITSSIPNFRFRDVAGVDSFPMTFNQSGSATLLAQGNTNANFNVVSNGTGAVRFLTNGGTLVEQLRVSHTASAVNYMQVTGAPTTGTPIISAQGSDANIPIQLRSKGTFNVSFANGAGNSGLVVDMTSGATLANYISIAPKVAGTSPVISALGTDTNIDLSLTTKGTGSIVGNVNSGTFTINRDSANNAIKFTAPNGNMYIQSTGGGVILFNTGDGTPNQMRVTHTASAVNYVQVTGAVTGGPPVLSVQGSDATAGLLIQAKGSALRFYSNAGSAEQFRVLHTAGTIANYGTVTGNVAGSAPIFSVGGSDTNIDLTLTPKGTGVVQFGTHTANADTAISGYITIRDAGGTLRKLAVIT